MRQMTAKTIACGLVLTLGSGGVTAQQPDQAPEGSRPGLAEIRKVGALLDAGVMNRANQEIAGVEDLVLSPDGRALYAILSRGGVAGIGAEQTAVPWQALEVRLVNDKWAVNLDLTEEALKQAPKFQRDDYLDLTNPQWVAQVHGFFPPRSTAAENQPDRAPGVQALQQVLRASQVIGAPLKNAQGQDGGEVEELLLDRSDRVAFAIVGHGGTLGIGEDFIPVPWSKLNLTYNREDTSIAARVDATAQQLEKAPLVKGDTYATLLAPGFEEQVRRYFGLNDPAPGTDRP